MSDIMPIQAVTASAPPFRARPSRPSVNAELARQSWSRAHQHFCAWQACDLAALSASYAPGAVIHDDLLGRLQGSQIERAAAGFARHTRHRSLEFQIERVGVGVAEVSWTLSCDFLPTCRSLVIEGCTKLVIGRRGVETQINSTDRREWSRQALGLKGAVLSLLPGWRSFVEAELRLALAVDIP